MQQVVSSPVRSALWREQTADVAQQDDEDCLEWEAHRIEQAILGEHCSRPSDGEVCNDRRHHGDAFLRQTLHGKRSEFIAIC
jgi:hypothetical protein